MISSSHDTGGHSVADISGKLTVAALGLVLTIAGSPAAWAQQPALPATPEGAAPATSAASGDADQPTAAPPAPDLSARVGEAEQTARIAVRRVEILEEQIAAKAQEKEAAAKDAATVTAGEKGFGLRSGDGAFVLKFHGLLQADTRWFLNDGALSDKSDTFLIRRMRPGIDGTLFGLVDFKFSPDFAGSTAAVFDAYVDAHPFAWLRLRGGKFKAPLGLERLQQDADLVFIERALTQNLTPQRDVGAALGGEIANAVVTYSLGVYNGAADGTNPDLDTNHAKDFVGRLLIQPFKVEGLEGFGSLGVHFAASTGNRFGTPTNTLLPSFKSGGQNTFFSYLAPAASADPTGSGTPFAHLRQSRINPGLFYYFGPFGVLGEYVWSKQEVQKGNTTANLTQQAGHATASFVIGGKAGYDGATPTNRLDLAKGTWGALEIGIRWNYLKLDNATFDPTGAVFADNKKVATKAQGLAGALTYVPSRTVRFAVNFEQTRFTGGSSVSTSTVDPTTNVKTTTTTVVDRKTENALFGRMQVNF